MRSETQGLLSAVARLMTAHAGQIDAMFTECIQPHPEFAVRVSGLPPHVSAHHLVERLAVYGEVHSVVIRPNATEASTWALVEFDSSHAAAEAVQPCNQLWYVDGGDGQPMTLSPVGAAVVYKVLAPCKLRIRPDVQSQPSGFLEPGQEVRNAAIIDGAQGWWGAADERRAPGVLPRGGLRRQQGGGGGPDARACEARPPLPTVMLCAPIPNRCHERTTHAKNKSVKVPPRLSTGGAWLCSSSTAGAAATRSVAPCSFRCSIIYAT